MNEKIFDKIIKVLWLIVAGVAIFIFYTKIDTSNRYELVMGKGKNVYRFDKLDGVLSSTTLPGEWDVYYEYYENGRRLLAKFDLPKYDGSVNGLYEALDEQKAIIAEFKKAYPNSELSDFKEFQNIIK